MATTPVERSEQSVAQGKELISYEEAMERLSRDERFRATVYSMNTLLVQKGIYSPEEFEFQFRQFAQKNSANVRALVACSSRLSTSACGIWVSGNAREPDLAVGALALTP